MTCPKCNGTMQTTKYQGIEVDRCASCGGLWFDLLEYKDTHAGKPHRFLAPSRPAPRLCG